MSKIIEYGVNFIDNITISSLVAANISVATLSISGAATLPANMQTTNLTTSNLIATNSTISNVVTLNISTSTLITSTRGILIGTNTYDNSVFINALDPGMTGDRWLTFGQAASNNNRAEVNFNWVTAGSLSNSMSLGLFGTRAMTINGSGHVGVGTNSPAIKFHVTSSNNNDVMRVQNSSVGFAAIQYTTDATNWVGGVGGSAVANYPGKYYIVGGNASFVGQTNGNWGISTNSPTNTLHVNGDLRVSGFITTGGLLATNATIPNLRATNISTTTIIAPGTSQTIGSIIVNAGLVGIGTVSPSVGLHVNMSNTNDVLRIQNTANGFATIQYASDNAVWFGGVGGSATTNSAKYYIQGGSASFVGQTNGNWGIGTFNPTEMLDVRGNLRVGGSNQANYIMFNGVNGDGGFAGTRVGASFIGERVWGGNDQTEMLLFKGDDAAPAFGPDRIRLLAPEIRFDTSTGVSGTFDGIGTTGSTSMMVATSGNVGIGTVTPIHSLDIRNSAGDAAINLQSSFNQLKIRSFSDSKTYLQSSGDVLFTAIDQVTPRVAFLANGNVGIGTVSPGVGLHVNMSNTNDVLRIQNGANGYATIQYATDTTIWFGGVGGSSTSVFADKYYLLSGDALFVGQRNGNWGLGTATPAVRLDIYSGDTNANSVRLLDVKRNLSAGAQVGQFLGKDTSYRNGLFMWYYHAGDGNAGNYVHYDYSGADNTLVLTAAGTVGIGTTVMDKAKFQVNGSVSAFIGSYGYLNSGGGTGTAAGSPNFSIYATDRIACTEFNAFSDSRIKENVQDIDDLSALTTLRLIEPKRYNYIDKVTRGEKPVWGFIAQQVESVLDYSTGRIIDYIPNVYDIADVTNAENVTTIKLKTKTTGGLISTGPVKIKLFKDEKNTEFIATLKDIVDENTFTINESLDEISQVFVYGIEVSDFHTLNKDAIFTVNVAATQELDREVQIVNQKYSDLEQKYNGLEQKYNDLEQKYNDILVLLQK